MRGAGQRRAHPLRQLWPKPLVPTLLDSYRSERFSSYGASQLEKHPGRLGGNRTREPGHGRCFRDLEEVRIGHGQQVAGRRNRREA